MMLSDDGTGMTEDALIDAMRFGGFGPYVPRESTDMGRFGLGLKTASLSQCRRLSVASKKDARISCFCWDLDHIRRSGDAWELLEGIPAELSDIDLGLEARERGTVVLWDLIDFGHLREQPTLTAFLGQIERAEQHLGMVFHRFLRGDARRLRISINGRRIRGWDPFLEEHDATILRPEQFLDSGGERISVRGFILPHTDRFANATAMEQAAGPDGWTAQQGFYVYRQRRLLSAGGWLGLGGSKAWTREEYSRLARIRIDLPNTIDEDWKIDIRKSQAKPPESIRPSLSRIAGDIRRIAREVFMRRAPRSETATSEGISRIWQVNPPPAERRFSLRQDHPLMKMLRTGLESGQTELLSALLEIIERTVPVDRIWLDSVENGPPGPSPPDSSNYSVLIETARGIVRTMVLAGMDASAAKAAVATMEPFDTVPEIAEKLESG